MIQPPPGAFDARVNDCSPEVVPGSQLMVTDAHEGAVADRLTVSGGGGVVDGVGTSGSIGGTGVSSSSVVVTETVLSVTTPGVGSDAVVPRPLRLRD